MITEEEALRRILDATPVRSSRSVSLLRSLHCFAAEKYSARVPLPGFDNSAMDGYAVGAGDRSKGARLRVADEQAAGPDRRLRVHPGEAIRIFTGAPIPENTSAVVMQEDVDREGDCIVLKTDAEEGEFIRRRACDLAEGQEIVARGQRIRPTTAALLASQGFAEVKVGRQIAVAVVSTGNELVAAGEKMQAGQLYDSNSILLSNLLTEMGLSVASVDHSADNEAALMASLKQGAGNDALIITGGVSVGEHDLVQGCIGSLGGRIDIWRVAVKPGKPFLFGHIGECAVFGLPGNPVSAFVTFLKFVRPSLLKMMGANAEELQLRRVRARLSADADNNGDRVHYMRGRYDGGEFVPVGRQESHALFGLSRSNALLRAEPGTQLGAGATVEIELWD